MEESFAVFNRRQFESGASREQRTTWLIGLAIAVIAVACYSMSLRSGFIYDARLQILTDPYIHNPAHFIDVLTFRVMGKDVLDFNRPVHLLSLMLDALIWGKRPLGYHLTSILLHALNTLLLFRLIQDVLERVGTAKSRPDTLEGLRISRIGAGFGALFFALHPVCVEAVAEVSFREDLLAALFVLATLHLGRMFQNAGRGRGILIGTACALCVVAACASKEIGVAAPVLLGLYLLLFRTRLMPVAIGHRAINTEPRTANAASATVTLSPGHFVTWSSLLALIGVACLAAGLFVAARFALEPKVSEIFVSKPTSIGTPRTLILDIVPPIWAVYLKNIVWPIHLTGDYRPESIYWIPKAVGIAILGVFWLVVGLFGSRHRAVLLGGAIFWLMLLPASNFLPMYRPAADRYMYAPMIGAAMLLACLIHGLWDRRSWTGVATGSVMVFAVAALGALMVQRQTVFRNSRTFWADTATQTYSGETTWSGLGAAYIEDLPIPYDGSAPPLRKGEVEAAFEAFGALAEQGRMRKVKPGHLWLQVERARELAGRMMRGSVNNKIVQVMPEEMAIRLGIAQHCFDILHSIEPSVAPDGTRQAGNADGHVGTAMVLEMWAQACDKAGMRDEAARLRGQADAAYLRAVRLMPRFGEPDRMVSGLTWERWQGDWVKPLAQRNRTTIEAIWKELEYKVKNPY